MFKDVTDRLIELTRHSDDAVAIGAIYALGEGASPILNVQNRLMELTRHSNPDRQAAAAKALGRLFRHNKG